MTYWQAKAIEDIATRTVRGYYQPCGTSMFVSDGFDFNPSPIPNSRAQAFIRSGWAELVKKDDGKTYLRTTQLGLCIAYGVLARHYKKAYKRKLAYLQKCKEQENA